MIEALVASYLTDAQMPPPAVGREKRTEQVNVRFTPSKRALLDRESARQGFRGVADLIRAEMIRHVTASRG